MFEPSQPAAAAAPAELSLDSSPNGFADLGLPEPLVRALATAGYADPTAVQSAAIPLAIAESDLMVSARTGSGKTAAFMLPALMRVIAARKARKLAAKVLVLTPTRELALQVTRAASDYGRFIPGLRVACIVGGVPYGAQLQALKKPLDLIVATPGRLIDHLGAGKARLDGIELLVLDEADRMLDMGFIDDIRHIASATPVSRQTVMFSATFAGHVAVLAEELLRNPRRVDVASHTDAHADIEQRLHWADDRAHKDALLEHILCERQLEQAVVFTSTQRDAEWLAERLEGMGHPVAALHGGMPQGRRNRVLQALRERRLRVLVTTDVAARGIDVPTISHVINYGLPMKEEDYVHRIGRTGRAGRSGVAVTLAERRDRGMIQRIQRFTTQRIPAAVIAGLEPRQPDPATIREHVVPRRGGVGKPGGKPAGGFKPGAKPGFGGGARGGFKPGAKAHGGPRGPGRPR